MSLNVLKRKSRRYQDPISGKGQNGFSLNGTHRNVGSVNPTNLGKSVTRTPFKGTEPVGNGGCCGTYKINIANSGSCCTNDNSIVKKTVKNTSGMIDNKYKWTKSQYPRLWVQRFDEYNTSQELHIKNVVASNSTCVVDKSDSGIYNCSANIACSYHIGGKKYIRMPYSKNHKQLPVDSSQYMRGLLQKSNCLPTPKNAQAFPNNVNNGSGSGCNVNASTPQEAINKGLLPPTWTGTA